MRGKHTGFLFLFFLPVRSTSWQEERQISRRVRKILSESKFLPRKSGKSLCVTLFEKFLEIVGWIRWKYFSEPWQNHFAQIVKISISMDWYWRPFRTIFSLWSRRMQLSQSTKYLSFNVPLLLFQCPKKIVKLQLSSKKFQRLIGFQDNCDQPVEFDIAWTPKLSNLTSRRNFWKTTSTSRERFFSSQQSSVHVDCTFRKLDHTLFSPFVRDCTIINRSEKSFQTKLVNCYDIDQSN